MTKKELIEKLQPFPDDAQVFMEDAGESYYGSEFTGLMWTDPAEVEGVRKIEEGILLSKLPDD